MDTGHYYWLFAHSPEWRSGLGSPPPGLVVAWRQAALLSRAPIRYPTAHAYRVNAAIRRGTLTIAMPARSGPPPDAAPWPPSERSMAYPDDLDGPAIADQSVPRSAADPRSERRSDDGQTILGAMTTVDSKPTTCTFGRDGGIRTRGLLLPNQRHLVARRSLASPDVVLACDLFGGRRLT